MESQTVESMESNSTANLIFPEPEVKTILSRLILKCAQEMKNGCLNKPIHDYVERVTNYTGLPKTKINKFISHELGDIDHEKKHFNLTQRIEIFKYIGNLYTNKQEITCSKIQKMCETLKLGLNLYQIQYMLSCSGFEYITKVGKEILIEDPELTYERFHYLKQISHFKYTGIPIYYLDERFFDHTFTFPKPWMNNIDISRTDCDGYVFFHAVSKRGLLHGFFCTPATRTDFTKWIVHCLIPKVNKPSVFVLDKNPMHRGKKNTITKYHSKLDMVKFLYENNITCNENLHKAEIYKLICEYPVKQDFDTAEIFKVHGHQILWLPDVFHDLSPTTFLWEHIVSSKKKELQNAPLENIKNLLLEEIIKIPKEKWNSFTLDLENLEVQLVDSDVKTAVALGENYDLW